MTERLSNFIATTCTTPGACQQLKDEIRTLRSYLMQARNIASLQQEQLSRGYKVHSKAADLTRKGFTACKALSLAKKDLELARKNVEECKIHYNSLEQLKKQLLNLVKEQEESIKELQETTKNQQKELKETNRVHKLHQKRYLETVEALTNNDKLPSRLVKWIKEVKAAVTTSPLLAVEEEKSDTELEGSGLFPSGGAPSPAGSRVRPFSTDSGIAPSPSDSGVGIDDNSEPSTPQPASTESRESPQSLESDEVNALVLTHLSKPLGKQSLLEPELEYCETNTLMSIHPDDILSSKHLGRDPLSDSDILDIDDEFVNILSPVDELTKPWTEEVHAAELKELPRLPNKSETEVVSNLDTWPSEASIISTPVSLEQAFETQNQPPLTASEPITEEPKSEDGNMLNPLEMPASSAQKPFTASSVSTLTPMGIPSLTFLPDMTAPLEETYISEVLEEDLFSPQKMSGIPKEDVFSPQKMSDLPKEDVFSPQRMSDIPKEDVFSPQRMSDIPKEDVFSPQRMSGLPKEDVFSPQRMSGLPKEDIFSPQRMSGLPKEDVFSPQRMSGIPKEDVFSPQKMSGIPKEDVFSPQKMSGIPKEDVFPLQKMSGIPKEDVFSPQNMSDLPKEDVFSPQNMSGLPKEDVFSPQRMSDLPKEDVFSLQKMSGLPKDDVFSPQRMSDLPKEDVFSPQNMSGIPKEDVFSLQKMSDLPKEDVFSPQKMSGLPKEDVFSPQRMSGLPKEDVFSPKKMSDLPKENDFPPQKMSDLPKEDVFSLLKMIDLPKEDGFPPQKMSGLPKKDVFSPQKKTSGLPKENVLSPQKMSYLLKEDVLLPQKMSYLPKEDVLLPQKMSSLPKEDILSPQKMNYLPKEDVLSPQKMSSLPKEDVLSPQKMSSLPKEDVLSPQKMSGLPAKTNINPTLAPAEPLSLNKDKFEAELQAMKHSGLFFFGKPIHKEFLEKTHQLDKDITPIQLNVGDVLVNEAFQGTPNLHAEKQVSVEVREEPVNSLLHNNGNATNEDNLIKGKAIPLKTQDSKIIFDRDRERDLKINEFTAKQEMCITKDLSFSNTGAEKGPSHTKTKSLKMKGPQQIQPVSQCTSLQSDLTDNVVERLIPIENTLELNESVTPLKLEVEDEIPNETVLKPLNLSVKKQYNVQDVMTESIQIPLNLSEKQFPFEICKQPPNLKSKDINVHTFKKIKEIHTPKNFLEEFETESEEGLFNSIDKKSPIEAEVLLKDPERDSFVSKKENDLNIHESKERQICIPRNSFKEDKMENKIDLVENVTLFNNDEEKPFIEYENSFIENENSLKPYAETSSCINENSHLNIEGVPPKPLNVYKAATIKMRKPLSIPFADKTPKEGKMRLTEEWLENAKISCISTNRLTTIPIKHQPDIGKLDKECVSFTYGSQQTSPVFKTEHDSPMSFGMICGTDSKVNLKGEFVSIEVKKENYGKEIVDQKSAKHEDNNYDIVSQIEKYEENVNVAQNLKPGYEENVNVAQNLKPGYEENVNVAQNLKPGYEENVNVAQNLKPGYEENVNVLQKVKLGYEENVNVAQNLKPGYEENMNVAQNLRPEYEENVNVAQNLKPGYEENVNVLQKVKLGYEENVNVAQNLKPGYEENMNVAQNLKPEYEENVNVLQKVKPGYEANVNASQIVKPKYKENSYASQSNTLKIKTEVLDDFDQQTNISTKIKSEKSETIGMPGIRNYTKMKPKIEVVDRFTDIVKVNKKADAVGDIYLIPNAKPKRIAHQVKSEKQELGDFQNAMDLLLKKEPSRELGRSQGKSQPVTPSIKSNSKISHSSGNTRLSVTKKPSLCALVSNKDEAQVMTSISDEKTNITKNMTSRKRRIMESKSVPPKKPSSSSLFSNKDEAQVMTSISDEQTNFTKNMTSLKKRIPISCALVSNKDEAQVMTSISDEQTNFTKNMTSRKRRILESESVPPKRIRKKMVEKDSTGPAISVATRKSSAQLDSPEPCVRKAQFPEPVELPELVPVLELPPQSALGSKNRENLYSESLGQSTSKTVALYRPRGHHMSGNQFQSHSSYTFEKYETFAGSPVPYFTENKRPYHSMVQNVMNMGIATSTVITTTPYPYPPKNFFKHPHPCNKHSSESVLFRDDLNEPDDPNLKRFSNKKPKFWHNVKDVTHFLSHTFRNFWRKNFKKKMFSKAYQEEINSMAHQKDEVPEILKQYLDELISLKDAIDMLVPRKFFTESHMISVNIIIEITRRSTEKAELPNYSRDNFRKKSYFEDSLLLLVAGLVRADERFRYLPQQLYDRVQLRLFRLHHTPSGYSVYSLTRFCVQLCLWQAKANNGIHREVWHDYISLFCYDALYCLNYSAIAVIYVTIHLYENILERVKEGKVGGRIKDVEACFLIIAKKNSWGWVYDNIIRKLLNLIDSWMKSEGKIKVEACMVAIRTVSFVCRSFDKKAKHMLEKVFKKIAEVIDAGAPKLDPIDMRCVVESLVVLKRHISPKLFIPTIIKVPECIHVHYTTVSQLYSNMKGTVWEGFSWGGVLATIPASTSVIHGSKMSKKSFNDSQNTSTESLNLPSTSTSSSLVAEPNSEASPISPKRRKTSK
uniref:Uncharacterized protein n=1 Tax=Timema tahoe TaxID=61484 RepID=A0A7R9IKU0_9NEOP|nr:unnamed protein product [Timema tahoe]